MKIPAVICKNHLKSPIVLSSYTRYVQVPYVTRFVVLWVKRTE